jgi:hypothetical protein
MRTGRPRCDRLGPGSERTRLARRWAECSACDNLATAQRWFDDGSRRLDGVLIRRLRWSVGYGPETTAWLLRPAGVRGRLPGVLGMHCHGGVRSVGAEQLVDLWADSSPRAAWLRATHYAGRAPANELARRGFVVLVHDTFSWGSRRFDLSWPTPRLAALLGAQEALDGLLGRGPWGDLAEAVNIPRCVGWPRCARHARHVQRERPTQRGMPPSDAAS